MTKVLKRFAPLVWLSIAGLAAWVLVERIEQIDLDQVLLDLRAVPVPIMLVALLCSAGVYTTVGLYEGIAVRIASGRNLRRQAFRTAVIANPLGRAIGVAMASGGALRYRMYAPEGLSIREVGAVILLVAMPYVFGVGWLIDLSLLLHLQDAARAFKLPVAIVAVFGVFGLAKDVGWLAFVASRKEPITIRGQSIRLPSLRDALVQIAFGLVQISLMTTILYLFMPPELNMTWPAFVAIYCISFVAGQVSNVPAGLGVLEAALFLLLPHVPPGKLVSAVLAYRAVYELIPLGVALSLLLIYETTNKAGIIRKRFRTSGSSP
ncbi:MAG TPA: YbhN family protein [Steroidobacteraceae bacterium]|jgi:phosphatidylglycerol lysyltransferase|nr:YbhN family protein [Steroidobacteraceae bacterium]